MENQCMRLARVPGKGRQMPTECDDKTKVKLSQTMECTRNQLTSPSTTAIAVESQTLCGFVMS